MLRQMGRSHANGISTDLNRRPPRALTYCSLGKLSYLRKVKAASRIECARFRKTPSKPACYRDGHRTAHQAPATASSTGRLGCLRPISFESLHSLGVADIRFQNGAIRKQNRGG